MHDAGYMIGDNRTHAAIMGGICSRNGFRHADAIAHHGTIAGLDDTMGVLLNIADMSVSSTGEIIGMEARLEDIADKYGEDSIQYHECSELIHAIHTTREWQMMTGGHQ
jgi:hypothetical protein